MRGALAPVRRFRWQQWLVIVAFVAALAFSGWQVNRAVHHFASVRHHREPPIAGWMTIGFVAHAYPCRRFLRLAAHAPRSPRVGHHGLTRLTHTKQAPFSGRLP